MNEKIAALQTYLNARGCTPPLTVDGVPGPATRDALIATHRNKAARPVTQPEINLFAARAGCSPTQLATVSSVESGGSGWDNAGLIACLWERHYLWKRVAIAVPLLSDPKAGGYTIDIDHDGINDSWEKLADASMRFGAGIAMECASFGKFQIMGAWWKKLGYPSVAEFVWGMTRSETAHYEALVRYIEVNNLRGALRSISADPRACLSFALGYNGPKQKGYDVKLARKFKELSA